MSEKKTIAIIGAGIVGVSAAIWLQEIVNQLIEEFRALQMHRVSAV